MNWHVCQFLIFFCQRRNIRQIKLRINPLRKHIQANDNNIKVACTLTIAKQSSFNAVSTGKKPHFTSCNAFATIIMRMQAYNNAVPV